MPAAPISRPHVLTLCAFAIGASLAMSFLSAMWGGSTIGWAVVICAGLACTALRVGAGLIASRSGRRRLGGLACAIALTGLYLLWSYLAVVFGRLLGWTVPWQQRAVVVALLVAWVAMLVWPRASASGVRRVPRGPRVPLVLPIGLWIALVLAGWPREEGLVRCDDYLALRSPVELVVATQPDLASCRPGRVLPAGRFSRTSWQTPDGRRVVFTTQGNPIAGGVDGAVCAADLVPGSPIECVGRPVNKSQGLVDLVGHGRLAVMQWGVKRSDGSRGAVVMEIPRDGRLAVLDEHWFDAGVAEGFYEPANSTLYMFTDEMDGIHRVRIPGFEPLETLPPGLFTPGEVRYDTNAGEGVSCGGPAGAAITGNPFGYRYFVDGEASLLERVSMTWGCDWDPDTRDVYVTVPNLGLLDRIDYDSGRVEKRWFVGFGMRSVEYDAQRKRVYFTDFLRGEVLAFDERSERLVDRWFVGRFSRWVQLTRDGRALLATGNLGIVRIPLQD
jgi:hypothetical protein